MIAPSGFDEKKWREVLVAIFFTSPERLGLKASDRIEFFCNCKGSFELGCYEPPGYLREERIYELEDSPKTVDLIHQLCKELDIKEERVDVANKIELKEMLGNSHIIYKYLIPCGQLKHNCGSDINCCNFWKHIIEGFKIFRRAA